MTDADYLDTEYAGCVAEYVALLTTWPEDTMATPENYVRRIEQDERLAATYRTHAAEARTEAARALLLDSARNLDDLTERHRAILAGLSGDTVEHREMVDAA